MRAAAITALLAAIALVAGCGSDKSSTATKTVTVTRTTGAPETTSTTAVVPSLKPTVEAFVAASNAADGRIKPWLAAIHKYGDAGCISTFDSMLSGQADDPDSKPIKNVQVEQNGTTGTSYSLNSDGSRDGDPMHWAYTGGEWKMTCDGIFTQSTN